MIGYDDLNLEILFIDGPTARKKRILELYELGEITPEMTKRAIKEFKLGAA
jgi:hypothetical protein